MEDEVLIGGVNDSGKVVRDRIADAGVAWEILNKLIKEDEVASQFRAKIFGQLSGNPPRDPSKMRALGLSGFSNVNFREGEGIIEMIASSFWELDMEVPQFIDVVVDSDGDMAVDRGRGVEWGGIIAEEYTRVVRGWTGYFYNRMLSILEMVRYGRGPVYWRDKWDWRFSATKVGAILFPRDTKALLEEPELVIIRDTRSVGELYNLIATEEDERAAREVGWDTSELRAAIIRAQRAGDDTEKRMQVSAWEAVQQALKNNEYGASVLDCNPVRIAHILIKDVKSGGITRYIIAEDEQREKFLYRAYNEFENMYQVICPFISGVGDGFLHSVKGIGHKIYPHVEQSDRFLNHVINSAYLSGSLLVTTPTPNSLSMLQFGPVTVLPEHIKPLAQSFMPNIEQMARVRMMLHNVLSANVGTFTRSGVERSGPPRTAHEVNVEEIKNARLEKTQINVHYLQLDALHREIFRRLANKDYPAWVGGYAEAKEFRERCKRRGVPERVLNLKSCVISAMRSVGFGSAVARDNVTRELLMVSDRFPEVGQKNAVRDFVAARVGHDMVNRYVPDLSAEDIATIDDSIAVLENNALAAGEQTLVTGDQRHGEHIRAHLRFLLEIERAYSENVNQGVVDATKTYGILMRGIQHISQHLQYWLRDSSRKAEKEMIVKEVQRLGQFTKGLEGQVKREELARREFEMQQAQAANNQMSPDLQLALKKIYEEAAIKRENMLLQNEIRKEKAQEAIKLSELKAAAEIARKAREQQTT